MKRLILAIALVAVALIAPAVAHAGLVDHGEIGTAAKTRVDAETFAPDPTQRHQLFQLDQQTGGATVYSAYAWPPQPWNGAGCVSGCAAFDGHALGAADVPNGDLRAAAKGEIQLANQNGSTASLFGYIFSDGAASIGDTITLSKATTVILRGSIAGSVTAHQDDPDQQAPDADLDVSIRFTNDEYDCDPEVPEICDFHMFGGFVRHYDAENGGSVNETFEIPVQLPAGTTIFSADMKAALDFQVYSLDGTTVGMGAHVLFDNLASFEIEVPNDVVANSGSGFLPIVGGASNDTTPPTITLGTLSGQNTDTGLCTASVSVPTPTASDDRPGVVTVTGERADGEALSGPYPVGTTTITWTATDAAGNSATAAQAVVVADDEAPSVSQPAPVPPQATDPGKNTATVNPGVATATDNCPGVAVTGARVDGLALADPYPVGTNQIVWTATDASGNTATTTQSFVVRGVGDLFDELYASLAGHKSLQAKARAAKASYDRGQTATTCNQLQALLNELNAQTGKSITPAEATAIRSQVTSIRTAIGC